MKKSFLFPRGQRGFGLIQVLFVISIVSVLLYLSLDNQMASKKIKKTSDFDAQVANLSDYVSVLLTDPFICSASVAGVKIGTISGALTASGTRRGQAIGGDIGFTQLKNAIFNPTWNNEPRPPNTLFYMAGSGPAHLTKGAEIRPGILIDDMRLLNDDVRDFVRITFRPKITLSSSKMGGQTINKDFFIIGEKNLARDEFLECNSLEHDASQREVCESQKGQWMPADKKCLMKNLITVPVDKIAVWIHADGSIKKTPSFNSVAGTVSCKCQDMQCGAIGGPCTCTLPTCDTQFAVCAGNNCALGTPQNFNQCDNIVAGVCTSQKCMYARPCGVALPADGYVIKML